MPITANTIVPAPTIQVAPLTQSVISDKSPTFLNQVKAIGLFIANPVNIVTLPGNLNQDIRPTTGIVYPRNVK